MMRYDDYDDDDDKTYYDDNNDHNNVDDDNNYNIILNSCSAHNYPRLSIKERQKMQIQITIEK